ncbi:MAG: glycosyltransferase family 39 protein [Bryobacterales bacterium]|nr:glycosyltransferase family 39 protein [Bryobacterales bacterium]
MSWGMMKGRRDWVVLAGLFVITLALLWYSKAFEVELGGYTDESAQVVTSLLIRDYVAQGFPEAPMRYAERYYVHYPRIAFGMWPPLYHTVLAGWLMVSSDRVWLFLFQATCGSLLAFLLYRMARSELGEGLAIAAAVALCGSWFIRSSVWMMMPDIFLGVVVCLASLSLARFFREGRGADMLLFGLWAGLSLSTKGNAIALAPVPILAMVLLRRWDILRRPVVYGAAGIAGAMGLPWQILMARLQSGTIPYDELTVKVMLGNLIEYPLGFWVFHGFLLSLAVLAGLVRAVRAAMRNRLSPGMAVQISLLFGFLLTHAIVTFRPEPRYYSQVMPALMLVAFSAASYFSRDWARAAFAGAVLVSAVLGGGANNRKDSFGMKEVSEFLRGRPQLEDSAILVSSRSLGEATLIGEMAISDKRRPSYWVLRASKTLSTATWYNKDYRLVYRTPEALRDFLRTTPIRYVVVDDTPQNEELPHHRLLKDVLSNSPEWTVISKFPRSQATTIHNANIQVYEQSAAGKFTGKIRISLEKTLGRSVTAN